MSHIMCALCTYYEAFVFINKNKMLIAGQKHRQLPKTQQKKALKDIEKALSNRTNRLQQNVRYQKIRYLHGSKIRTKSCHL